MEVRELFSNPWARFTLEAEGKVVRLQRTSEPLTLAGLEVLSQQLSTQLPPTRRRLLRLLFDTRLAPLASTSTDPKITLGVELALRGFARRVVLVRTAVGKLQANRFNSEHGNDLPVTGDEADALAFLLAP